MKTYYDPPNGWKYGWPKALPKSADYKQELLDSGYPEEDIEFAMRYTRVWGEKE